MAISLSSCGTSGPNTEIPRINGPIYIVDVERGEFYRILDDGSRLYVPPTNLGFRGAVVLPRETRDELFGLLPRCRDWGDAQKETLMTFDRRHNGLVQELME